VKKVEKLKPRMNADTNPDFSQERTEITEKSLNHEWAKRDRKI